MWLEILLENSLEISLKNLSFFPAKALMEHAAREGSFDGGDQGLLNTFFSDWATADIRKHLPFLYNMVATASYTYLPAYKRFGDKVKIVHFIGTSKPWHAAIGPDGQPAPQNPEDKHAVEHLKHWWMIYRSNVRPGIPSQLDTGVSSDSWTRTLTLTLT